MFLNQNGRFEIEKSCSVLTSDLMHHLSLSCCLTSRLVCVMCRQVAVQWTTLQQAAGAVVQYGTNSGQYTGSANATFDTYTASQMCGGEAATTGYLFPGE